MADSDRVQDALAAYLEHLEVGGAEPDVSHLTAGERGELSELLDALELTEGIAFGRGPREPSAAPEPATPEGERLLEELRDLLPPGARLAGDDNRLVAAIGDVTVVDRFVIGTFGGRVRVWLVDAPGAGAVEEDDSALGDLEHVFRMFPDMAAVALVGRDLTCLVVEPEDTAPRIRVPSGSLVSRRYKRAIGPVGETLPRYLDELVPYWDPMPAFDRDGGIRIDVAEIAGDHVRAAMDAQRRLGERSRTRPKKDALSALGDSEVRSIDAVVQGLFDGSIEPGDVESRIERVAGR
ncbi:MAG TPA: hypothetical protein VHN37_10945 [Actinomycetota bacterium]|nr:hypothetical protein [Actinomycetota bacterium]